MLLATDSGHFVVLMLLDLRAAFDTEDHHILMSRLENWAGFKNLVERSFCVGTVLCSTAYTFGVPQGSLLGPHVFSLCLLPFGSIH